MQDLTLKLDPEAAAMQDLTLKLLRMCVVPLPHDAQRI